MYLRICVHQLLAQCKSADKGQVITGLPRLQSKTRLSINVSADPVEEFRAIVWYWVLVRGNP